MLIGTIPDLRNNFFCLPFPFQGVLSFISKKKGVVNFTECVFCVLRLFGSDSESKFEMGNLEFLVVSVRVKLARIQVFLFPRISYSFS